MMSNDFRENLMALLNTMLKYKNISLYLMKNIKYNILLWHFEKQQFPFV